MHALQAQGKIGLHAICKLLKQSRKIASADLAAATPEAHVFSGNLSHIFGNLSCILCLFTGWAQVVTQPHAPVECAQPKDAVHRPVGSGLRSLEQHQILGCAQQTPWRGLIDNRRTPLLGVWKGLPKVDAQ